eukprot:9101439-Pyramimonas_sp.AAC.2
MDRSGCTFTVFAHYPIESGLGLGRIGNSSPDMIVMIILVMDPHANAQTYHMSCGLHSPDPRRTGSIRVPPTVHVAQGRGGRLDSHEVRERLIGHGLKAAFAPRQ